MVLTRSAREFVGAVTFEALTGRAVHSELIATGHALDHIRLAREAHAVVVAPATADFMARAAAGRADDLLAACLLATSAPVLLVPAMNDRMWEHPQTVRNVAHLREIGYVLLDPEVGDLAVGEGVGPGRMPEPETIVAHAARLLRRGGAFEGRHVVVTAGPTREAIDPVRFISNRSSGRMGVSLARAAWERGARVTLVAGPLGVAVPTGIDLVAVETAGQMLEAVAGSLVSADLLIMAAAPGDFRAAEVAAEKIAKGSHPGSIRLDETPDILRTTRSARREGAVVVGFALETGDAVARAREKLQAKDLDLIVANDATEPGAGFEVETNRVTLIGRDGEARSLPLLGKRDVAEAILDRIEEMWRGP